MEETDTATNKLGESEQIQKPRPSCMERGPGPARYILPSSCGYVKHDPTKVSKPAYSFGIKPKKASTMNSPGPVYYVNPYITRNGISTMPSFTMYGRINLPSGSGNYPSPGTERWLRGERERGLTCYRCNNYYNCVNTIIKLYYLVVSVLASINNN